MQTQHSSQKIPLLCTRFKWNDCEILVFESFQKYMVEMGVRKTDEQMKKLIQRASTRL
jgi:hypothetical protein